MNIKLPILPTSVTPDMIRNVLLPVKIQSLNNALKACDDPYLLKPYSDNLQALAAAVRYLQHEYPEECRQLNRIAKYSQIRLGEVLSDLNYLNNTGGRVGGSQISERGKMRRELGLRQNEATAIVRLARAPEEIRKDFLETDSRSPKALTFVTRNRLRLRKALKPEKKHRLARSEAVQSIYGNVETRQDGLLLVLRVFRKISSDSIKSLTLDERALVRGMMTEIKKEMERINEELDRR